MHAVMHLKGVRKVFLEISDDGIFSAESFLHTFPLATCAYLCPMGCFHSTEVFSLVTNKNNQVFIAWHKHVCNTVIIGYSLCYTNARIISTFIKYVIIIIIVRSVTIVLFVQDPCLCRSNHYIYIYLSDPSLILVRYTFGNVLNLPFRASKR